MVLVGAVPCRDAVEFERKVHIKFAHTRILGDGGTEYFKANADEVLDWMRSETPRFEIESARKDAWAEYIESRPFKIKSRLELSFFFLWAVSPIAAIIIYPSNPWVILIAPVTLGLLAIVANPVIRELSYIKRLIKDLELVRSELETKYHLPPGGVRHS
jgi:hypothetical protein